LRSPLAGLSSHVRILEQRVRHLLHLSALFCLLAVLGCQKPISAELVPVQGKLLYKNKPVAHATISFIPDGGRGNTRGIQATAETDNDGNFALETYPHGDGAMPGHYKVTCITEGKNELPKKYSLMTKTPLVIEVPAEGNAGLEITLKD
jgi:hypothetical protein